MDLRGFEWIVWRWKCCLD